MQRLLHEADFCNLADKVASRMHCAVDGRTVHDLNMYNCLAFYPEGPSTLYLRTLVPNTIQGMVIRTRDLQYWVVGPSGLCIN